MLQETVSLSRYDEPPVNVTFGVLRKRIAVLREPHIRERIIKAVPTPEASRLSAAVGMAKDGVDSFLGSLLELLDLVIFDIFSPDEEESTPSPDYWEFVRAIHLWHNGSILRGRLQCWRMSNGTTALSCRSMRDRQRARFA